MSFLKFDRDMGSQRFQFMCKPMNNQEETVPSHTSFLLYFHLKKCVSHLFGMINI